MLRIAVTEYDHRLEEIIKSFPAQLLISSEDLTYELIRAARIDVAIVPRTPLSERRFSHRGFKKVAGLIIVSSSSITKENKLILEDLIIRLNTTYNALNRKLLRLVASKDDADKVLQLLKASFHTDVFYAECDAIVRFEAVTDLPAFYDILTQLHEAGARQISLISIEKYY